MNERFSCRSSKAREAFIPREGRVVTTLRDPGAVAFVARADAADKPGRHALMQRATGNFERGNER